MSVVLYFNDINDKIDTSCHECMLRGGLEDRKAVEKAQKEDWGWFVPGKPWIVCVCVCRQVTNSNNIKV